MSDRHTRIRLALLATVFGILASACTSSARSAPPNGPTPALTPMGQHIDAWRIRQSGAATAWDALRRLAPVQARNLRSIPTRRPEIAAGSGMMGLLAARIVLDGAPVVDPGLLRGIPADDVISIDMLGALDAVMLFGQGYGGGAIVIRTRRR